MSASKIANVPDTVKFFKTTYTVVVLSLHSPATKLSLENLDSAISLGGYHGFVSDDGGIELTPKEMVSALNEFGSTAEFFDLQDLTFDEPDMITSGPIIVNEDGGYIDAESNFIIGDKDWKMRTSFDIDGNKFYDSEPEVADHPYGDFMARDEQVPEAVLKAYELLRPKVVKSIIDVLFRPQVVTLTKLALINLTKLTSTKTVEPAKVEVIEKPAVHCPVKELGFDERNDPENGNVLITLSVVEDQKAMALGYEFLGVAKDASGAEVHLFRMAPLESVAEES